MTHFLGEIRDFVNAMQADHGIKQATLEAADTIESLTITVLANIGSRKSEINGCAVDYMHAFGYLCYSYMFAMMVEAANGKKGEFYTNKAKLADYFVGRILPRIAAHAQMVEAGSDPMMNFDLDYFNVPAM